MITHTSSKANGRSKVGDGGSNPGINPDGSTSDPPLEPPSTKDATMQVNHIQNTSEVSNGTKQLYFDFKTPFEARFSLAIRGVRTCVTVSRVLVYQYQCPRLSNTCGHATQQAPTSGAVVVGSNCAESYYFSSIAASDSLMCTSEGKWLTCEYFEDDEEVTCKGKLTTVLVFFCVMFVFVYQESKSVPGVSQPSAPSQPHPHVLHSSHTPLPASDQRGALSGGATVEDRDCQSPTALLATVAVLIAVILALVLTVVALTISMMNTHIKFRPDKRCAHLQPGWSFMWYYDSPAAVKVCWPSLFIQWLIAKNLPSGIIIIITSKVR